jgi:serine protease SohB
MVGQDRRDAPFGRDREVTMNDFLTEYVLFAAKTLTGVLAVVVVVALLTRLRRHPPPYRLEVTDVNRRLDDMSRQVSAGILPARAVKRQWKADKRRRKADDAARLRTGPDDRRPRTFVLDFHGDIRASAVSALREEVTAVLTVATPRDSVLVRLDNSGGTVPDHGLAASQLLRIRQRDIPLTISVDRVAASGGYLMACVADRILAAPFAVVGSIGVIAQLPNFHRLLDRHGVEVEQFKGGEFKRTVTMFGRNTDADRDKLTEEIQDVHTLFKDFVGTHRPRLDIARVATGEHWYGTRAVELGLVDEIVTSDDHLLAAREGNDIYEVRYHRRRSLAHPRAAHAAVDLGARLGAALNRVTS